MTIIDERADQALEKQESKNEELDVRINFNKEEMEKNLEITKETMAKKMDWIRDKVDDKLDNIGQTLNNVKSQAQSISRIDDIERLTIKNVALLKMSQQENKELKSLHSKRLLSIEEKLCKLENLVLGQSMGKFSQIQSSMKFLESNSDLNFSSLKQKIEEMTGPMQTQLKMIRDENLLLNKEMSRMQDIQKEMLKDHLTIRDDRELTEIKSEILKEVEKKIKRGGRKIAVSQKFIGKSEMNGDLESVSNKQFLSIGNRNYNRSLSPNSHLQKVYEGHNKTIANDNNRCQTANLFRNENQSTQYLEGFSTNRSVIRNIPLKNQIENPLQLVQTRNNSMERFRTSP